MTLIDEVTITATAGRGGDGVVRWRHEKNKEFGGPSGGNGGRGGSVYARAVRDTSILANYRTTKHIAAKNGEPGGSRSLEGRDGDDVDLIVPVGSILTNTSTGEVFRLDTEDERVLLLSGGTGGRGNESYKSSRNKSPEQSTPGSPGESGTFHIELELIADIGLIGLPSAGKSTLLNTLTNTSAKTGAYHFTTLEPNLGAFFGYVIADIPGLIEGASQGKGLGYAFLRHIRRTRILAHLVSLESDTPLEDYKTIRKELESFDPTLIEKDEVVILSKADLVDAEVLKKTRALFEKQNIRTASVSVHDPDSVKHLRDTLTHLLEKNTEVSSQK